METPSALQCEIRTVEDPDSGRVTMVACHGQLVASTASTIRNTVKPLIAVGGPIILDLTGVDFVDSMGLGALVALKASAINAGDCTLLLSNLSDRIQELLKMTNLTELFRS
jgi:anti-sigma B factor antagonist